MSEILIRRRQREVEITLHTATSSATTINIGDMAGGVVSFGTMSTNAATLQMFGAVDSAAEFRRLYNTDGSVADVTLTPSSTLGRIYSLPDAVFALPYLKVVSGTTNSTGTTGIVSLKS
jgi:hypothetical protein